jgi:hypothetical protein
MRFLRTHSRPRWAAVAWVQGRNTAPIESLPCLPFPVTRMDYLGDFGFGLGAVVVELAKRLWMRARKTLPAINATAVQLLAYFTELAAKRRAVPRDDLLSDLLAVSDAGDGRLTDAELLHNLTLLLVAGLETMTNLLGNGLQIILQHLLAGEGVRDGSIPPSAFVEEVLRFDSPVQLTSRLGYDTKVGGLPVSREPGWSRCSGRGTGIRADSPNQPGSIPCVPTAGPSASAAARTSASAPRWLGRL